MQGKEFIKDDDHNMMHKHFNFSKGVMDSDDLPLTVSQDTLQWHK